MQNTSSKDYKNPYIDIIIQGLREQGKVRTMFSGKSMKPTLEEGMQILVEEIEPAGVEPADIILYRNTDSMVVHRVIKIIQERRGRVFVTKGDNHAYIDSAFIPEENLIGIVRGAFRQEEPEEDILIKSSIIGTLYVIIGNMVLFLRQRRKYVPQSIRRVLRYFIGGFFFLFKKSIHVIYLGIYYGLRAGSGKSRITNI